MNRQVIKRLNLIIFVLPLLALYTVFFTYPLFGGVVYSFTNWNGINSELHFIGIRNFVECFRDVVFLNSIRFTLSYTVLYTVTINVLGLLFAILVNMKLKSRNAFRMVLFSPYVLNVVTIGFTWGFILGKFMISLNEMTNGFPLFTINWLMDDRVVIYTVLIVRVWVSLGFFMILYLAGLQSIPIDVLEASTVDGATGLTRFRKITLPLLMPSVTAAVFMALVSSLRIFEILMALTQGGPGSATESISYNIYREAFERDNWGFASAKSVIFMGIIIIFTVIQLSISKRREVNM